MTTPVCNKRLIASSNALPAAITTALICLLVYLRALGCDFVRMDDTEYVVENLVIRNIDRAFFEWAFTTAPFDLWMPLTWMSFAFEYHFWKLNPFGYHLTNIMLHAVNACLVVLIADKVLKQGQWAGDKGQWKYTYPLILLLSGLLWGIHPLRVESVAWVAERKDVLNGLFTLGTVLAYLAFAEKKVGGVSAGSTYLLSLLLFACSLMAKPVSVVLPFMLLVMDWFPLERLSRTNVRQILIEKLPFLMLSVVAALMTLKFGAENKLLVSPDNLPLMYRVAIAGNALLEYYRFMLFPADILPFFLLPNPIPYSYAFKAATGVTVTAVCLFYWRKKSAVVATWLLFILPMILVSGLLQNGMQSLAARYTYLPAVPVSIAAAGLTYWGFRRISEFNSRNVQWVLPVGIIILLLFYGGVTWQLIGVWKDTASYWSRIIEVAPRSYPLASFNRGKFYYDTDRLEEAVKDLTVIIDAERGEGVPKADNVIALRGEILAKMGRFKESLADYDYAISVYPEPSYLEAREKVRKRLGMSTGLLLPKSDK